uniref:ANK_REP_REGION domain-containing protein n=1 Tax=Glossina austeni TaxID=7395 RepID=A0A1A9V1H5_GLOAU
MFSFTFEIERPLHLACISGSVDVVAALICMAPHPCLLNIQNDDCQTPLHLAALTAQPKILRMLLIAGAEEQCVRALIIPISPSEINEARNQYGNRANDKTYLSCARLPSDLEIRNYDVIELLGGQHMHSSAVNSSQFRDSLRLK